MRDDVTVKKHKIFKLFILLLLLVGMVFLKEENRDKFYSFIDSLSSTERQLELVDSINVPPALNLETYGENISIWSENKISLFDIKGNLKLEKQFSFEDPIISFGDNYICIGDKSTGDVYVLDENGETIDRINFEKQFFNIKEENKSMLLHSKSDGSESIYIYDNDNVLIGDNSFTDKNIINYALGTTGEEYALSTIDLNENILKSKIMFYGKNNEELYDLDIDGEIVLHSQFTKKDNVLVLTDKSLYSIKKGKIMWQKSFSLIKDIYIEDKIYILYSNYLESMDFDGRTIEKLGFNKDYQKIFSFNRDILVYGDNGLSLISDGKEILKHEEDIDILSSSKDNIIIFKNDKLDIYKVVKN